MTDLAALEAEAKALIAENAPAGWTFRWSRTINVFGSAEHTKKVISVSKLLAQTEPYEETVDTIKHEIAHAIAGHSAQHNTTWKAIAADLGARPEATSHAKGPSVRTLAPWVGTCPAGHTSPYRFFRKPSRVYACSKCSPVWSRDNIITYTKEA